MSTVGEISLCWVLTTVLPCEEAAASLCSRKVPVYSITQQRSRPGPWLAPCLLSGKRVQPSPVGCLPFWKLPSGTRSGQFRVPLVSRGQFVFLLSPAWISLILSAFTPLKDKDPLQEEKTKGR